MQAKEKDISLFSWGVPLIVAIKIPPMKSEHRRTTTVKIKRQKAANFTIFLPTGLGLPSGGAKVSGSSPCSKAKVSCSSTCFKANRAPHLPQAKLTLLFSAPQIGHFFVEDIATSNYTKSKRAPATAVLISGSSALVSSLNLQNEYVILESSLHIAT